MVINTFSTEELDELNYKFLEVMEDNVIGAGETREIAELILKSDNMVVCHKIWQFFENMNIRVLYFSLYKDGTHESLMQTDP